MRRALIPGRSALAAPSLNSAGIGRGGGSEGSRGIQDSSASMEESGDQLSIPSIHAGSEGWIVLSSRSSRSLNGRKGPIRRPSFNT